MKEILHIENFGGIKNMQLELKSINIFIGPQASGKSISAKLLFFFKKFFSETLKAVEDGENKRDFDLRQKEKFITYFPKESWPKSTFRIIYKINESEIFIERESGKALKFNYSENLVKLLKRGRKIFKDEQKKFEQEERLATFRLKKISRDKYIKCVKEEVEETSTYSQFFVPAGRSFFANVQTSIFSFLSNNKSLDPFLIEFGSFYEDFKRIASDENFLREKQSDKGFERLIDEIMNGSFLREKDKDFIVHKDKRKVNLSHASSGQQETLPLVLVLKTLNNLTFNNGGATLYIEEPEAHLFPTAQKKIVQILARTFNHRKSKFQIIVTTHSPYILSSFNNLLEAGKIISDKPDQEKEIHKIVPKEEILHTKDLMAFSIFNGDMKVLIDNETQLISQNILDSVSDEIAIDFGKLLDIGY